MRHYCNASETVFFVDFEVYGTKNIFVELAVLDNCPALFNVVIDNTIYLLQCPKEALNKGLVRLTKATFIIEGITKNDL